MGNRKEKKQGVEDKEEKLDKEQKMGAWFLAGGVQKPHL